MKPYVSIVIGFRDWGVRRIRLAAESALNSFGDYHGEVIISDYGSFDPEPARRLAADLGVKYVLTEGDPNWSRSRALNAGFSLAEGELLVSTDADMIFSPGTFEVICQTAMSTPNAAFFLQCRDLPEQMDDEFVARNPKAWKEFEAAARLRPRWGMGGMMAISRQGYEKIRGFDERLHTYGGEDIDFANRAARAGYRIQWIDDPRARMYHMWHPSSRVATESTEEGRAAAAYNSEIARNDLSFVRNYMHWAHRPAWARPLVTVAIATKDRATLLRETLMSILCQSVQDYEILVVDDGGTDDTKAVVESFNDHRIRYVWQESAGISSARNFALELSQGLYTAVIDDDDLMHPHRLAWHLDALEPGTVGNCGSFVNFDNETGDLQLIVSQIPVPATAAEKGGAPGHGTWFLNTEVMRKIGYDETLTSGVDNNFFLRLLRAGAVVTHTGLPVTLRRMHNAQVTVQDNSRQASATKDSKLFFQWGHGSAEQAALAEERASGTYPKGIDRAALIAEVKRFLPDHLTSRTLQIVGAFPRQLRWDGNVQTTEIQFGEENLASVHKIIGASYKDLVIARQMGLDFAVIDHSVESDAQPIQEQLLHAVKDINFDAFGVEALLVREHEPNPSEHSFLVRHRDTHSNWTASLTPILQSEAEDSLRAIPGSYVLSNDLAEREA